MLETLRILMLEDSPTAACAIGRELQRIVPTPFSLRCEGGRDGFRRALHEFRPHVVLTDGVLPDIDAARALHLLHEVLPGTPAIVVSGRAPAAHAIGGAVGCVLKHRLGELGPVLQRALAHSAFDGFARAAA